MDYQKLCFMESWYRPYVLWLASRGSGKALSVDTPIPTPLGLKRMGDINVGDFVYDYNHNPTKVTYTSEIFLGHECFKVTFDTGESIIADSDHLWNIGVYSDNGTCDNFYLSNTRDLFSIFNSFDFKSFNLCVPGLFFKTPRKILSISRTKSVATRCIQVDNIRNLYLCGETNIVTHNTTLAAVFLQTKMVLIPNYKVFISTNSAGQSIEVFKKLEDIALQRITSFRTCTDVFAMELERSANSETGFLHNPSGHSFRLFNNSELVTLSTNIQSNRGKRGSVLYDETAWQTREQMAGTESYASVDPNFGAGTSKIQYYKPLQMPLQLLYASSAGDVNFPFYDKYREFSKKMFMGDPNYYVCDLNVDTILYHSTIDGNPIKSHISKELVDKTMKEDPDSGAREFYNKFQKDAGQNSVVPIDVLIRNSKTRLPLLYNDTGSKKFIFCYDPARANHNSILSIFQLINDPERGYILQVENVVSMVDTESEKKTPLMMPDQVKIIHELMIAYNGETAAEWENIEFYIDAGSGGGGLSGIADVLLLDWKDSTGIEHRGIIDPVHKQYETARKRYKDAVPIVHLLEPTAYKKIIYDSLSKMSRNNLMQFTSYEDRDTILVERDTGEIEDVVLSDAEKLALMQINIAKKEIQYMCRQDAPGGSVTYELAKDKKNTMNDDRAYTFAMGAYALAQKRRDVLLSHPPPSKENKQFNFSYKSPKIK